jgi:glyoxylase-like metal-dependent hydrolase (beta-lactamase superfamily II)
MIFRQLFHADTGTYTYLLGCEATHKALLIDPVVDNMTQYIQLLRELNLKLVVAIDTHVHADHITALGALRDQTGCISMMGQPARAACVSKAFADGDVIPFGKLSVKAIYTPGHTDDSYSFLFQAAHEQWIFTGDTLLIRGSGRTDFQNGNAHDQYRSIFNKLLLLPGNTRVYPGHDYKGWTMSTIAEEKAHNPRLQVADEAAYVQLMGNLKLANPKHMDVAVPANLACGNVAKN